MSVSKVTNKCGLFYVYKKKSLVKGINNIVLFQVILKQDPLCELCKVPVYIYIH